MHGRRGRRPVVVVGVGLLSLLILASCFSCSLIGVVIRRWLLLLIAVVWLLLLPISAIWMVGVGLAVLVLGIMIRVHIVMVWRRRRVPLLPLLLVMKGATIRVGKPRAETRDYSGGWIEEFRPVSPGETRVLCVCSRGWIEECGLRDRERESQWDVGKQS